MGYSVSCVCVDAVFTFLPVQLLNLLRQNNWMLWQGDVHLEFSSFQVSYCANLLSVLSIPSPSFTSKIHTQQYQAQASLLRNTHPLSQLPRTTIPQMQLPATHAPPVAVLTDKVPSQIPNYSRESPICLSVAARAASITAGSSPWQCSSPVQGEGLEKCSSLVRAHTGSPRQNTFTAAVIDCLCNNHTLPASFFRKKTSDWNRWGQIKTDCTEQAQSNGELGILSKYKKPMCFVSELETEIFHSSF